MRANFGNVGVHPGRGTAHWDSLCLDVRQIILSKLPLPDLTKSARTNQEFWQEFLTRGAECRARFIAIGEEAYGEPFFAGIVTAVQRALCGLDPCPGVVFRGTRIATIDAAGDPQFVSDTNVLNAAGESVRVSHNVFINEAGEAEVVNGVEARRRWLAQGRECHVHWFSCRLCAGAQCRVPGGAAWISFEVLTHNRNDLQLKVVIGKDATASHLHPCMGLLVAICTRIPEAMRAGLQRPITVSIILPGRARGVEGQREVEELLGPLKSVAEYFLIRPHYQKVVKARNWWIYARHPLGLVRVLRVDW